MTPTPLPTWLALPLGAGLAIVAGFGIVGLALAVAGVFFPLIVVPLGAAASIGLFRAARLLRHGPTSRSGHGYAFGATIVASASALINATHTGQHVLIDRDPGAYVNTGRWLSTHHSLEFPAKVGAFRTVTSGLSYSSPAIYGHGARMRFQFSHLLGVLLAEARWVGGDHAMFLLTPVLGGVAIVAFYALTCRFVAPVAALVATAALAANLAQMHFARDPYAEIVVELVLFGCVWLLTLPDLQRPRAIFAGVLLGATVAARLDGPLYLAAIPMLIGFVATRRRGAPADDDLRFDTVVPFSIAAVVVTVIGVLDVEVRVPEYARYVGLRVLAEYAGLVGATAAAILLAGSAKRVHARLAHNPRIADGAAVALSATLLAMWLVRPHVQEMRGKLVTLVLQIQRNDHLPLDPGRHYFEDSLRWHAWYLGAPALAAGIVGAGWFLHRTLLKGSMAAWVMAISFGSVGAVYIWNAAITPDQLWVMRRFVPIVIPGFLLFAAVAIEAIATRFRRPGYAVAGILAVLMVAWPISADAPVWAETSEPHALSALNATCRALGPDAAVVVVRSDDAFHLEVPQALRGFCNVPVALARLDFSAESYVLLARQWRTEGRVLNVIADAPGQITAILPHARPRTIAVATNDHVLEQTLNRPPRHYTSQSIPFVIATVPLAGP